jgi:hypothetical protein
MAAYVVGLSRQLRQQREEHRFADRFPIRIRLLGRSGVGPRRRVGLTVDHNANGMRFRTAEPKPEGTRIRLSLPLATGTFDVRGTVLHVDAPKATSHVHTHGMVFEGLPLNVRDAIELHCTQHAVPIWQQEHRLAVDVFARTQRWFRNSRGHRRVRVRFPAIVSVPKGVRGVRGGPQRLGLLDDFSRSGARLVLSEPLPPDTRVRFSVPGTAIHGQGRVVFSQAMETPVGVRFAVGVRRGTQSVVEPPRRMPNRIVQRLADHIVGS